MAGRGRPWGDYTPTVAMTGALVMMRWGWLDFDRVHAREPVVAQQLRAAGLVTRGGALTSRGFAVGDTFDLRKDSRGGAR